MPGTPTPNMGLTQPSVGGDFDIWGNEINGNNTILDSHTHQLGSGIPITPLGLNINSDLSVQGNNINAARSVRLVNNTSTLAGAGDVGDVYQYAGNLYYNNSAGVPVQITNGTVVNSSATAATIFPQTSASSNFTILASATFIELLVQTTSVACTVTLPAASSVAQGRYFIIKDVTGNAAAHNVTITAAGSDTIDKTSTNVLSLAFQSCFIVSDASSNWSVVGQQKVTYPSGDVVTIGSGATLGNEGTIQNYRTINHNDSSTNNYSGGALITGDIIQTASALITGGGSISTSSLIPGDGYIYADTTGGIAAQVATGIVSGVTGGIALTAGASDWVTFGGTPRTRTIVAPITPVSLDTTVWDMDTGVAPEFNPFFGSVSQINITEGLADANPLVFPIPLHNGATLASVTITFAVTGTHATNAPQFFPNMSVIRSIFVPGTLEPTSVWLNPSLGIPISTAGSGPIWVDSQNIQTFTYTCTQNNVIDTSQYIYSVVLYGEYGSHSATGDVFFNVTCSYTNINNMQFP